MDRSTELIKVGHSLPLQKTNVISIDIHDIGWNSKLCLDDRNKKKNEVSLTF